MKYTTIFIFALLVLSACTVLSGKQINETISENNSDTPTSSGTEKLNVTGTPVHACTLFTAQEGSTLCGTDVQISGMQNDAEGLPFNCVQTFIQNRIPYDRVIINIMDYKTSAEADSKYNWDLKVMRGKETKLGLFYVTEEAKDIIEFKDGQYVARIFDMPSGACKNISQVTELAIQRLHSRVK